MTSASGGDRMVRHTNSYIVRDSATPLADQNKNSLLWFDDSWVSTWPDAVIEAYEFAVARGDAHALSAFDSVLLEIVGISELSYSPSDASHPLIEVKSQVAREFAEFVGASACASYLLKIIDRISIKRIQQTLGSIQYQRILGIPTTLQLDASVWTNRFDVSMSDSELMSLLGAVGSTVIFQYSAGWDPVTQAKLRLKFPQDWKKLHVVADERCNPTLDQLWIDFCRLGGSMLK